MFNRRLLIDSRGKPQTYSILEIHVDEADGGHISAAHVEIAYDGKSNIANTDNKGIALFSNIPTGTEITYNISKIGYNTASGTWIIDADVEYETEYVVLTKPLPAEDTDLWSTPSGNMGDFFENKDIIIPANVNVILVGGTVNSNENGDYVYVRLWTGSKSWIDASDIDRVAASQYIGVTPGKRYAINIDLGSSTGNNYTSAYIKYSQRINAVKPTVLDY